MKAENKKNIIKIAGYIDIIIILTTPIITINVIGQN